jgi:Arc/MetJ-type ribon-helix-helix transcriptional regulator
MPRFSIRIADDLAKKIERAVSERGFDSASAFFRHAISRALGADDSAIHESEDRIVSTLERVAKEIRRLQTAQQAEYALLDSFIRLFLMCVAEPSEGAFDATKARAAARYNNFIRNVAHNMTTNSWENQQQLVDRD